MAAHLNLNQITNEEGLVCTCANQRPGTDTPWPCIMNRCWTAAEAAKKGIHMPVDAWTGGYTGWIAGWFAQLRREKWLWLVLVVSFIAGVLVTLYMGQGRVDEVVAVEVEEEEE